jgi:hypothetical protein
MPQLLSGLRQSAHTVDQRGGHDLLLFGRKTRLFQGIDGLGIVIREKDEIGLRTFTPGATAGDADPGLLDGAPSPWPALPACCPTRRETCFAICPIRPPFLDEVKSMNPLAGGVKTKKAAP